MSTLDDDLVAFRDRLAQASDVDETVAAIADWLRSDAVMNVLWMEFHTAMWWGMLGASRRLQRVLVDYLTNEVDHGAAQVSDPGP